MFSHFTLGTGNLDRSRAFYEPVLAILSQRVLAYSSEHGYMKLGLGDQRHPHLFLYQPFDGLPATFGNGFHIAFVSDDTQKVDNFYNTALSHGGSDEGAPGIRANYSPDYYCAYVRDPDGNKLQAVCYTDGVKSGPTGDVVSYITIGLADLNRERAFYGATFGALGYVELTDQSDDESAAYGVAGFKIPTVFVQPTFNGQPATSGNGTHSAFIAPSRDAVARFHSEALAHGGRCEGPPGLRPQYSQNYFAAYVRDGVGNKLQAVCRLPE